MNISQLIAGLVMIVVGVILIIVAFFTKPFYIPLIYGIPILIIGFFIFFNKKEDKIELIKKRKGGKK